MTHSIPTIRAALGLGLIVRVETLAAGTVAERPGVVVRDPDRPARIVYETDDPDAARWLTDNGLDRGGR